MLKKICVSNQKISSTCTLIHTLAANLSLPANLTYQCGFHFAMIPYCIKYNKIKLVNSLMLSAVSISKSVTVGVHKHRSYVQKKHLESAAM